MMDEEMKVQLIEINSNPCMDRVGPHLQRMLPQMIEHIFQKAVDPVCPAPVPAAQQQQQQSPGGLASPSRKTSRSRTRWPLSTSNTYPDDVADELDAAPFTTHVSRHGASMTFGASVLYRALSLVSKYSSALLKDIQSEIMSACSVS